MPNVEEITKEIALPIGAWLGVGALVSGGSSRETNEKPLFLGFLNKRKTETELLAYASTGITVVSLVLPKLLKM